MDWPNAFNNDLYNKIVNFLTKDLPGHKAIKGVLTTFVRQSAKLV